MIKSDDFGDVRPQFCFVRPRWCLSRTYVLSGEKNYLQPCSPDPIGFQIVYIEEWKKNLTFKFIQYLQNYAWKNPSQYISINYGNVRKVLNPILLTLSVSKKGSQQVPRVHYQNFEVSRVNLHINQTESKLCTPNCKIKIQRWEG